MILDYLFQSIKKRNFNKVTGSLYITMENVEGADKLMKSFHRFFVSDGSVMVAKKYIKIFRNHDNWNEIRIEIRDGLLHDLGLSVYMTYDVSGSYVFQIIDESNDIEDEMDNKPNLCITEVNSVTSSLTPVM